MFAKAKQMHSILIFADNKNGGIMYLKLFIKEVRKEKGISLRELHKRSGVSIGHLSEIENGIKTPSFPIILRIAHALDTPLKDLYKVKF